MNDKGHKVDNLRSDRECIPPDLRGFPELESNLIKICLILFAMMGFVIAAPIWLTVLALICGAGGSK